MQEDKNIQNPPEKEGFFTPLRTVILWVCGILGTLGFSYRVKVDLYILQASLS